MKASEMAGLMGEIVHRVGLDAEIGLGIGYIAIWDGNDPSRRVIGRVNLRKERIDWGDELL